MQQIDYHKYTIIDADELVSKEKAVFREEDFGKDMWLRIEDIKVDINVQRDRLEKHVDRIVRRFDPSAFGRLQVTQREDGNYYCVDGQHRLNAARNLGLSKVPCVVIECPTVKEEGLSFININETTAAVSALDKYRVGVTTEQSDWLRVKECLDYIGAKTGSNDKGVSCVTAIYKYVNKSKLNSSMETNISIAKKSLRILDQCFGVGQISSVSFNAMCAFVRAYVMEGEVSTTDMIERLRHSNMPSMLKSASEMKKNANRGKMIDYVAYIIYIEYNKNLRKKLPMRLTV